MPITDVSGVYASGAHCGIKSSGALDLAFIYVPNCVGSAMVLSQNNVVSYTLRHNGALHGPVQLIIINSGNANCLTGDLGRKHVEQTVEVASRHFQCKPDHIAVASTGIIGVPLPIDRLLEGIGKLNPLDQQSDNCAGAILTTDLTKKSAKRVLTIDNQAITIAAITKGSGMIAPNMATTLGFIVTDVYMNGDQCKRALTAAIDDSYNMLSVDTDTSTNDMVTLQSSGKVTIEWTSSAMALFTEALTDVCQDLAKQIAKDGEGAKHFIQVDVSGADSLKDAKAVAKQVVDSPLVKTAVAGEDPNWGRIAVALGKNPAVSVDVSNVCISINQMTIFSNGRPVDMDRQAVKSAMSKESVQIDVRIGHGDYSATAWGCDLTHGYIDINTAYN